MRTAIPLLLTLLLTQLLTGCGNVSYYLQSVGGQLEIWQREVPVERLLGDPDLPPTLKAQLERALRIRDYASRELGLPDNRSYRSYADLARPFVVWNVFAAAEFSTEPRQWCFAVAGCVGYRGYFSEAEARRHAATLAAAGDDVYVGGVPAYSTIGWFDDPLLNTFIHYPEPELARLLFHELAHQLLYVKDDTVFNESFATVVEQAGVTRWLAAHGSDADRVRYAQLQGYRADFRVLVTQTRAALAGLYAGNAAPEEKRRRKAELLSVLQTQYRQRKGDWSGFSGYDRWFAQPLGNAHLASVAIYTQRVPAFEALLRQQGGDLPRFYAAVRELAALPAAERNRRLDALAPLL
ncbi:MAG: aminopeptidase [Burkholderiales bacterium]|nr:aminopeptidase [Burkholderiales bacterium]